MAELLEEIENLEQAIEKLPEEEEKKKIEKKPKETGEEPKKIAGEPRDLKTEADTIKEETEKIEADRESLLRLNNDGKLIGWENKGFKRCSIKRRDAPGFGVIIANIFVEDQNGDYIIVPSSSDPNKAIYYPVDASKLDIRDMVYPTERRDEATEWRIEKPAQCIKSAKIEGNWELVNGGKVIGPSRISYGK